MGYAALVSGVGMMGTNHVKTILRDELENIELAAVCDCRVDALLAFQENYPNIPVFLIPRNGVFDGVEKQKAYHQNIPVRDTLAEIIKERGVDTLVNATHNDRHLPTLEDALNARKQDGKPFIEVIFQEKPFSDLGAEAAHVEAVLEQYGIVMNLNSILTFSPVWDLFNQKKVELDSQGYRLSQVFCSYGKDRRQDTRPAHNGWIGMESIHPIDISTMGATKVTIKGDDISKRTGFLSENANPETGDGVVDFATEFKMMAKIDSDVIPVHIEGSFAWSEQVRRVQYFFKNEQEDTYILQVDVDTVINDTRQDHLCWGSVNAAGQAIVENEGHLDTTNKLLCYYKSVIDPSSHLGIYDLKRATATQGVLDDLNVKGQRVSMHSNDAPKAPTYPDITDIVKKKNQPKHF